MKDHRFSCDTGRVWRLFAMACLVCFAVSCASTEEKKDDAAGKKEEKEDRFAFLRHQEKKSHVKAPRETLKEEQVKPVAEVDKPDVSAQIKKVEDIANQNSGKSDGDSAGSTPAGSKGSVKGTAAGKKAAATVSVPGKTTPFYEDFIALNADEELPVSLIFNGAPLLDVLSAFADILGFNFVADNDIRSMVTLNLNSTMTRRELWNTFDRMIFVAGCAVKVEDSLLRIVPRNRLAHQPDSAVNSRNSILYFPLNTATAREAMLQLRPLLSTGAGCIELSRPNAVLVYESEENIPKIKQILEYIDKNCKLNWPLAVIPCRNVMANKIVTELQEILPVLGFYVVKPNDRTQVPGGIQLIGLDRVQVVIASAANKEAINVIREWVKLLDSPTDSNEEQVFVYKVRHNKAAHLVRALSVIFDVQGSSLSVDTNTGNTRIETINPPRTTSNATYRTTAAGISNRSSKSAVANNASGMLTAQSSDIFTQPTRIFADGVLNRLIIRTNPRTYASIKALLDRLDVVPAQALLQVMVVEVTLNESTQFGLEFSGQGKGDNIMSLFGTNYSNGATNLNPFILSPVLNNGTPTGAQQRELAVANDRQAGVTAFLADPDNPQTRFGYIRALAGNGLVKIISSPQILVSSNTEALVQVGSDVPVLSTSYTSTSSLGTSQETYDYKETGIILKVTPQITSTDLIAMEVRQELSSAVTTTSSNLNTPTITRRIVETTMTIANGQTMVIGGLIQEMKKDNLDSLPFINKIPFLNRLLGSTDANVERSEILVMVTGYIVDEHSPVEEMIKRYNDAIKAINEYDKTLGDRPDANSSKPKLMTSKEFWLP